jgi:glycosyltransferase involved in cell wall biosynthesis
MKILQFVTRLELGGAQEICLDLCRLLRADGHTVHLLSGDGGELMPEARRIEGLRVHAWGDWHRSIRPLRDLRCTLRLVRLLRAERFDVLHTHSSKAGLAGRIAAVLAGTPPRVIHHVHGWSFNDSQPRPLRWLFIQLERLVARPGFVLLACGRAMDEAGRRAGIGRDQDRRVVVNGIDPRKGPNRACRRAARRRLGLAHRELLVLQVGNLKPQKDPVTFARVAAEACRALPRARFWIAGDGPLRVAAEEVAAHGGLGRRFRVLGWRTDVPELLAAADALVLTSRFEGLPMAILRAMAAGLPVVATDVPGTREAVVPGRTGILAAPGDVQALAAAVVALGRNPGLRRRMGAAGRRRSRDFSARRAARRVLAMYREGPATPAGARMSDGVPSSVAPAPEAHGWPAGRNL